MIFHSRPDSRPEITAICDRPIINAAGASVRHLIVTVRAPEQKPDTDTRRPALNLGLVIDASGSMTGDRLESAKLASLDVIDALNDDDHMSLVSFANEALQHATAVPLSGTGRRTIAKAVRSLVTRGSTNLAEGWLSGCEAVAGRQASCDALERNHVVLLSDGHANLGETDPRTLSRHAAELRRRGIVTSTVGVGSDYSPTQLQSIAEAGGGRMHDAERPDEIARIVMAELHDTLATTIEHLEIGLTLPEGTKADVYGTAPCSPTAEGYGLLVGSLIGGCTRRLVVALRLPAGRAGETLALGVKAHWKTPGDDRTYGCEPDVSPLTFATAEACRSQLRSEEITKLVAEHWQAHIYHRAMLLNQDGREQEASEFVREELPYLLRYCQGIPELCAAARGLERFSESVRHRYSSGGSKEMLLRSYKTSRNEIDRRGRDEVGFAALVDMEDAERAKSGRSPR